MMLLLGVLIGIGLALVVLVGLASRVMPPETLSAADLAKADVLIHKARRAHELSQLRRGFKTRADAQLRKWDAGDWQSRDPSDSEEPR